MALALFLIGASGRRRVRWAFALVAICTSVWSFCTAVALSTSDPFIARKAVQGSLATIAFAGPLAFDFAVQLARVRSRWLLSTQLFSGVVAALLLGFPSLLVVVPRPDGGFWPRPSVGFGLAFVACVPPVVLSITTMVRAARNMPPSRHRRQMGWTAMALGFGGIAGLDVHTIFDLGYPLGWAACTLSCGTLFYAIVQYRLLAIATVVQRMLVVGVGLAAVTAWVAVLAALWRDLTPGLVAGWVLFGFAGLRLWSARMAPLLLRLFDARHRRMAEAITVFERSALDARTRKDVLERLSSTVADALGARVVALEEEVARPDPVLRDLIDLDAAEAQTLLAELDRCHADALLPMVLAGENVGTAALAGGALRAADDDLAELLARLGEAAARAFTNARLYEEVAQRSTNLEAEVKVRTAELERALHDLTSAQAKLAEAERSSSLGLLVAGVSHEINNALNFISANLPTLGRYLASYDHLLAQTHPAATVAGGAERVREAQKSAPLTVTRLSEAMRRTSAIVEDLRKFARPDAERRLFRVTEGLDAALNLLRRRTEGRLEVVKSYGGTGMIEGYPGPLNQCFFNLLLNAVEAARGAIRIAVSETDSEVEVTISDDGDGVPPELEPKIFQPFFTTRPKAAGLGLTVSRAIVERHGGTVSLARAETGGARVEVHLPTRAPEA
jgi:signal transduction histidine kinase